MNQNFNLSEEYSAYLQDVGDRFVLSFMKRRHTLPIHIQIVCGMLDWPDFEKLLIKKPHLANVTDDAGRVPLMVYWHSGLHYMSLRHGANPNACDIRGNTVLMYQRKNPGLIKTLVKAGADINAKNKEGKALITMALEEGLPIQPLLDAGAEWQPVPRDKKNEIFLNCLPVESIDVLSRIVSEYLPSEEAFYFAKVWSGCHDQAKFDWLKSISHHYAKLPKNRFTEKEERVFNPINVLSLFVIVIVSVFSISISIAFWATINGIFGRKEQGVTTPFPHILFPVGNNFDIHQFKIKVFQRTENDEYDEVCDQLYSVGRILEIKINRSRIACYCLYTQVISGILISILGKL